MEEKKYLDYQGLQTYHENLQSVLEHSEQATAEALDDLDDRLKIIENKSPYSKSEIDQLLTPITNKLENIEEFAEVNVQSDWNQTDTTADDYIKNKPTIPSVGNAVIEIQKNGTKVGSFTTNQSGSKVSVNITVPTGTAANKDVPISGNADTSQVVMGNDSRLTDSRNANDVYSWAKASSKPTYTASEVGAIPTSEKGAKSGVATLDSAGKVPASQLPSYVDDVLEYDTKSKFPTTGEAGKIYVDKSTNTTWRWSGSAYTQIKGDLVIGTTTGTAADGGVASSHYNNTSNPHGVTKAQVGLGSVVNTGDSATPVSGGTTKFTTGGAYTELNKKVDKVSGKGLSTNDYTTDEKNKLSGIASGAQANVIETVKVNGTALTPSSKAVNVTVPTKTSELTNDSDFVSDASYVHTDNNYTATEKSKLSGIASGAEVNQNAFSNVGVKVGNTTTTVAADAKTDTVTLIQGSNVTLTADTTNDTVTIAAKDTTYSAATTTAAGLMSADDKTKLNGIAEGAEVNVQSDWNATSGDAFIKNKPTIPAAQVNSDWNATSGVAQILNKPTIPTVNNGKFSIKGAGTEVASTTANASSASSVDIVAGSNVTVTPDATNKKITIAATNTTYGVVSSSANGLAPKVTDTSKFLKGDGTWATPTDTNNRKSFYGTCDTAAATAAKVITLSDTSGWELKAGTIVGIKFTNTNSASNVTLNVNSSGAKSIWYNNAKYTGNSNSICGYANRVTYYMYDGTHWVWLNMGTLDGNTDTKVAQTVTTTSADYEVLFSATADNTTRTEGARKNSNLKFNPSTGNLQATQLNGVTIGSSPKFTDTTYSSKEAASGGTDVSLVTTGEKYAWNNKTSNTGTVTSVAVKMNGATKGTVTTSGTIDLGTVLTSHQDISGKADKSATVSSVAYNTTSKKITKTINGTTSDVVTAAKIVTDGGGITSHQDISGKVDKTTTVNGHALSGNVTVSKSDVGLGNVTNDAQVKRSEMGAASGVATLDSNGKVPSSQLPSYVDDVIEGYFYNSKFYKESAHTTEITGETGKIYVDLSTNKTYRWGGSAYAVISETLALGETSSTAYRGDRGKTAYTHSQTTSGNPHNVTKSDVGLGNVGNFKAVSTVASQGLSATEKSNARANIGAGTSSFSGSYNDLSDKPTIPAAAANGTYTVKTLVGSTTTNVSDFTANQSSADDVTFVQGSNVTITPDATNRKITIAATDTTYSSQSASSGSSTVSLCTRGEKYTWNNKQNAIGSLKEIGFGFTTCSTAGATAAKVASLSGFVLKEFAHISVLFTNGFTTTDSTLNVNGTGAKPIYFCGSAILPQKIIDNTVVQMVYDSTNWNVISIEYFNSAPVIGAVDLGLPSGILWAERNVGASTPEDWGLYFSWGNVDGYSSDSGHSFSPDAYNITSGAALTGDIAVGNTYDAARHNLGGPWRMPTQTEFKELVDNCNSVWTQRNGVSGRLLTSRINGNFVFFPAAGRGSSTGHSGDGTGYYWSSTLYNSTNAHRLDFNSSSIDASKTGTRSYGFNIRAVI